MTVENEVIKQHGKAESRGMDLARKADADVKNTYLVGLANLRSLLFLFPLLDRANHDHLPFSHRFE